MKPTSAALLTTQAASTDDSSHPLFYAYTLSRAVRLILTLNMDVPLPPPNTTPTVSPLPKSSYQKL